MPGPGPDQDDLTLHAAIERTEGLQPWRRVFHATNGTLVVLALAVVQIPVNTGILILAVILGLTALTDVLRLFDPKWNVLFFRAFASLASPREAKGLASSTWYALAVLLVLLLFPRDYALASILVLAWADPAANVIGQRWGKTRFLCGTVRGTAAFVVVAFMALVIFVPWWLALTTAVLTAVVEAAPLTLDDNLLVPLAAGGFLLLMGG